MIRDIKRYLKNAVLNVCFYLTSLVPKQKNLVLFGSWFGQKYSDNTRYLYEYVLHNCNNIEALWMTKNEEVYQELVQKNLPVVKSNSLKGILKQVRGRVFIGTLGYEDFNLYLWGGAYLINCWHGVGIKKTGFDTLEKNTKSYNNILKRKRIYTKFSKQIILSTSKFMTKCFDSAFLIADKIIELGQPRNDLFYNPIYRVNNNVKISKLVETKKMILYMPTHRLDGKLHIDTNEILDLDTIQKLCIKHDSVFLIKKHFYHRNERENLEKYDRIFDITNENVDSQMLLYQANILITDYSSCCYDYLLLDRPILYYCYDIDDYLKNDRDMYVNYLDVIAGPLSKNKIDLSYQLEKILNNNIDDYINVRKIVRDKFYNKENQQEVCPKISKYIEQLLMQ